MDKMFDPPDPTAIDRINEGPPENYPIDLSRREDCRICHVVPGFGMLTAAAYYGVVSYQEYEQAMDPKFQKKLAQEINYHPRTPMWFRPKVAFRINCGITVALMLLGGGLLFNVRIPIINN
jgi:hypothetical protein